MKRRPDALAAARARSTGGASSGERSLRQQNLGVCSAPTIVGNRAYVVTNSCEILCLDVNGQANGNDGAYDEEGKFIAGDKNPPVSLEKTDGDIIWKYDLVDDLGVCPHDVAACSILVDGDILYCTSANGVNHEHSFCLRPDAPSFIALDARRGSCSRPTLKGSAPHVALPLVAADGPAW